MIMRLSMIQGWIVNSGDALDIPIPIYIDAEGGLLSSGLHLGRNTIERINHLANDVSPLVEWEPVKKQPVKSNTHVPAECGLA